MDLFCKSVNSWLGTGSIHFILWSTKNRQVGLFYNSVNSSLGADGIHFILWSWNDVKLNPRSAIIQRLELIWKEVEWLFSNAHIIISIISNSISISFHQHTRSWNWPLQLTGRVFVLLLLLILTLSHVSGGEKKRKVSTRKHSSSRKKSTFTRTSSRNGGSHSRNTKKKTGFREHSKTGGKEELKTSGGFIRRKEEKSKTSGKEGLRTGGGFGKRKEHGRDYGNFYDFSKAASLNNDGAKGRVHKQKKKKILAFVKPGGGVYEDPFLSP